MKIWLSKNSEIPVREQIITQITIGIASGDLPVGERLPSTREIALRYKIHSNTVSNAYQILAEQGWLEFRKGSGFYVRESLGESLEISLDKLIAEFVKNAQNQGFSTAQIKNRVSKFFDNQPSNRLVVVENDVGLRDVLIEELRETVNFEVIGASFEEFCENLLQTDAIFAAMFDEKTKISAVLPPEKKCVFLKTSSVADSMKSATRPTENDLIAVVSGWANFLVLAKTMLIAAQIESESLIVRSTKDTNWRKGLSAASMIICDFLTAKNFPNDERLRVFRLVADESLGDLKKNHLSS